jgi:2-polyprenyl-3-methyl-5-hydroxy-6-metoxy-1,4-benzoquinol methylase
MMPWAKKFAWSNVAKQWDEEFKKEYPPRPKTIEEQANELMEDNQALKAWELVKDLNNPIKDRVWLRVKHAFNPEDYKKYYSEQLAENPMPEEIALDCTKLSPRFKWVIDEILERKPKNLIDFGCADGYFCLTLAKQGIECFGVNLYEPSIKLAKERAIKFNLDKKAGFVCDDLFNISMKTECGVMLEVLEHLPDPQKGVDHVMKLLDKNGVAFFSTPRTDHLGVEQHKAELNHKSWDDGTPSGHLRLFTEKEFKDLFKKYKTVNFYTDSERCMIAEVIRNEDVQKKV